MAVHHQLPSLPTYNGLSASRIQSLYADIARQKHSNPTSYRANVAWWHTTLDAIVARGWQPQSNDKLILHADPGLPDALRYEGAGKPLCLGTVVTELASTHALIPHAQFLSATQSIYDPGWLPYRIASYVIAKPLWWALQQLNVVGTEDGGHESDAERWRRVKGDYVVVTLLERAADAVLAKQRSRAGASLADSLYSFDSFRAEFAHAALPDVVLSDSDLRVLVKYLERDRRAVITDKEVIKFIESSLEPPAVTAVDQGLLELKTAVSSMSAQVDSITAKIDACTEKAGAALRQKRKELALSYIRSRKQLETLLTQRLGSLEILQSTLLRVEAAADDIQILKTYESSTTTLRTILAHPALQRAAVEGTLEALASASADAREVDDAVRLGGEAARADAGLDIDEDELEAELAALVAEGEAERREREDVERVRREQEARESVSLRDVEQSERAQGSRQEAPVREALAEAA
ncbi:hypothetical protein FA95DRAFT_1583128 [Auriscalpium vulgare]|uniref:Uncharacterized protein n=1 Tax=Auriscalpium vulgare TaxID=40419 RepID=A0ACB8RPQ3_9AGAM|nr:hypothetical protein FA95DRAFT_1583128 [Auriscalpium vulgare]